MADKTKTKDANLDKFLNKVDDLESVIKGMTTGSENEQQAAVIKADKLLEEIELKKQQNAERENSLVRTGVNRTVINKNAYNEPESPSVGSSYHADMSQDGFMASMEQDVQERTERRKVNMKAANALKLEGNEFFKCGEFEKAVEKYTEALTKIRDVSALYTNRAMAYNKLGRHEECIEDCDWALRVDEKCSKAYVQQGRAYLGLKMFDEARDSFRKLQEIDGGLSKMVEGYLHEVDVAERLKVDHEECTKLFKSGDESATTMADLISKLKVKEKPFLYYAGGLRVVSEQLKDGKSRKLFRSSGGFDLLTDDTVINQIFYKCPKEMLEEGNELDVDIVSVLLDVLRKTCVDNEENQQVLLTNKRFCDQLAAILENKNQGLESLQVAAILFLLKIATYAYGIQLLIGNLYLERYILIISRLATGKKKHNDLAADLFCLFSDQTRYQGSCRKHIDHALLPLIENLESVSESRACLLMTSLVNLTSDDYIRSQLNQRQVCWRVGFEILKTTSVDLRSQILAFLTNLSTQKSDCASDYVIRICNHLCKIMQITTKKNSMETLLETRMLGLLSHLLPKYGDAVGICAECDTMVEIFIKGCQNSTDDVILGYCIRCLTCCSQNNDRVQSLIQEQLDPTSLTGLISHKNADISGNALLCLTSCLSEDVVTSLTESDLVRTLIVLVRDTSNENVKKNAAILLAKLATGDSRHLARVRELNGIEILAQNLKAESL